MKNKFFLGALVCLLGVILVQPASAGEQESVPAASSVDAGFAMAPVTSPKGTKPFDWNGFYVGGHVGGAWGEADSNDLGNYNSAAGRRIHFDTSGFNGGMQIGYNWQPNILNRRIPSLQGRPLSLVVGAEADIGYLGNNGRRQTPPSVAFGDTKTRLYPDFYVTARARAGLVLDDTYLIYATGGYMGLNMDGGVRDSCNTGATCGGGLVNAKIKGIRHGWTVGGGLEAAICDRLSVKGEYLHYDVGTSRIYGRNGGTNFPFDIRHSGNVLRIGANYKFDFVMP